MAQGKRMLRHIGLPALCSIGLTLLFSAPDIEAIRSFQGVAHAASASVMGKSMGKGAMRAFEGRGTLDGVNPPGIVPPEEESGPNRKNVVIIDKISHELAPTVTYFRAPSQPISLGEFQSGDTVGYFKDPSDRISELWQIERGVPQSSATHEKQTENSRSSGSQKLNLEGEVWKNY
ncbi:MAG: hypothetical protein BWK76_14165 [Desulfobulbaceae bacterium A2]|nr:MAG: hypothetical protein BWK76_14165 [Desulfobulbaceae bacterium A2]